MTRQSHAPATSGDRTAAPRENPATAPVSPWAEQVAQWTGRALQLVLLWLVVGLVLLPFSPRLVHRVGAWAGVLNVPGLPTFFSIVLVFVVTMAVLRRLRIALWFVVIVWQGLAVLIGAAVVAARATHQQIDPSVDDPTKTLASAVVGLVVIVVLVSARRAFPARLRRGALWSALAVMAMGWVGAVVSGFALLQVFPGTLPAGWARFTWAAEHATGLQVTTEEHHGHGPTWVGLLIGLISAIALIAAITVFLRSGRADTAHRREDDLTVRELLIRYPGDSLGYFATRADRSVIFTDDREAAVSYRVLSGVCLAAGDPIGDPDRWATAIDRWLTLSRTYGWVPAATSLSPAGARAYQRAGLHPMTLGDESVILVKEMDLSSSRMRPVRRAADRPRAAGYTVQIRRQSQIPPR